MALAPNIDRQLFPSQVADRAGLTGQKKAELIKILGTSNVGLGSILGTFVATIATFISAVFQSKPTEGIWAGTQAAADTLALGNLRSAVASNQLLAPHAAAIEEAYIKERGGDPVKEARAFLDTRGSPQTNLSAYATPRQIFNYANTHMDKPDPGYAVVAKGYAPRGPHVG